MKSPDAMQKVKVNPARIPGIERGSVIRRNEVNRLAPRSFEALIRLSGIFSREAYIGIIMKGMKIYDIVIIMATWLYRKKETGALMIPVHIRNEFSTPSLPSIVFHVYARSRYETHNGIMVAT
tara:strand:+ start:299 stop:667 length:369 start_codon:yes stop_codon:yes gene_type:complete